MTCITTTKVTPALWSVYRDGVYIGQVERVGRTRRYRRDCDMYAWGRARLRDAVRDMIAEHDLREMPLFDRRKPQPKRNDKCQNE